MGKARLHHFDILKGIAIFMVIMGHVITMCIRDIDSAVLFKFVERIHMPIFFFISGYFTYKVIEDGVWARPKMMVRVKQCSHIGGGSNCGIYSDSSSIGSELCYRS